MLNMGWSLYVINTPNCQIIKSPNPVLYVSVYCRMEQLADDITSFTIHQETEVFIHGVHICRFVLITLLQILYSRF